MYAPKLITHANVQIERERTLPIKGKVHVEEGAQVQAGDKVLSTELKGDLTIIRIAEKLGISPGEAEKGVLINKGDIVQKNHLLFKKKGLFGLFEETLFSPCDGIIEFIIPESGHIGIRSAPEELFVNSYIPGRVTSIINNRKIIISSNVGLIQGVFGIGGEISGKIFSLSVKRDEIVDAHHINNIPKDKLSGSILCGGMSFTEEAFIAASILNVLGIVCGSFQSNFISEMQNGIFNQKLKNKGCSKPPVLMITEGFGQLPISERADKLIKSQHLKNASMSGKTQIRAGAIRPEIIFHEADKSISPIHENKSDPPKEGEVVRIVRGKHFGEIATISKLPKDPVKLNSGVEARVVEVILEADSKKIILAMANIENV